MMTGKCKVLVAAAALALTTPAANAAFTSGNLAVERIGDGTQTLGNTGNTINVDEYTPVGVLVGSLTIPDSGASALIVSGTAVSEGTLSRSGDGKLLSISGYNTNRPFASSVVSATSATVQRGVGLINSAGTYTLAGTTNTQFNANNIRTSVSDNGANIFAGGANSGTVLLAGNGTTNQAGTPIQTTNANTRVNNIYNGNLYYSLSSGTAGVSGVYAFSGVPTAAASATQLVSIAGTTGSPYDFAVSPNGNTVYIADDRSIANGGGVLRYDNVGGTFTLTYTLATGAASTVGARGIAVDFSGASPIVYATTAETTADRLISIIDTGAASTATTLATSGANQLFRGLEFTPTAAVPEPTAFGLLGLGALAVLRRRRNA